MSTVISTTTKGNFRNGPSSFLPYMSPNLSPRPSPSVEDGRRPKHRRTTPSVTYKQTAGLVDTYRRVNPSFTWLPIQNPRRVLTKDPRPAGNNGFDNKSCDMILTVGDVLVTHKGHKFRVLDMLGQGTFGQVVKCRAEWFRGNSNNASETEGAASDTDRMDDYEDFFNLLPRMVAVKVVKNKPAYFNQAKVEIKVLKKVGDDLGPGNDPRVPGSTIIRLLHEFEYHHHLCLVFELMSVNLYELIKHQEFRGLPISTVRVFAFQLLDALGALCLLGVVHCDLKPENVLLENFGDPSHPRIKLIDLGSACYQDHTVYTYIQSRFYRAPEVILGLKYGSAIDLWSLGCCVVELFMGLPVFPGVSAHNQLVRIVEMVGMPPVHMLKEAKKAKMFFVEMDTKDPKAGKNAASPAMLADAVVEYREDYFSTSRADVAMSDDDLHMSFNGWRLKTPLEWANETGLREGPEKTKRYVKEKTLHGIVAKCEAKRRPKSEPVEKIKKQDIDSLVDFCSGLLRIDPSQRWTAAQAALHPFVLDKPFDSPFIPGEPEPYSEVSSSAETGGGRVDNDIASDDEDDIMADHRVTKTLTAPLSIKQKPGAAASTSLSSYGNNNNAASSRGSQKRKISDVTSPQGSLSSALGSPITRPEAPYPIAHAARWSDLGLLGSPAFASKVASPHWALPGGESPFARMPSSSSKHFGAGDFTRLGVSLPASSVLGSQEVRHTSFRKIDFDLQQHQPSWVRASQDSLDVAMSASVGASGGAVASMGASLDSNPFATANGTERGKSPESYKVEKSLAKWAPFDAKQLQQQQQQQQQQSKDGS